MAETTEAKAGENFQEFPQTLQFIIADGETIAINRPVGLNASGYVQNMETGLTCVGIAKAPSDGNYNHLTGSSTYLYKVTVQGAIVEKNLTVTGVTGITDVKKPFYATDNQTFTLTPAGDTDVPAGYVREHVSGTTCDVYWNSLDDYTKVTATGVGGANREVLHFGTIGSNSLGGTAAVNLITYTAKKNFNIISLHAQCTQYDTGVVAGDQDLNLEIGSTDLTGGVLNIVAADVDAAADMGVEIDATAITGNNTVAPGDVITLEMAASGTGFTAAKVALVKVYCIIEPLA